MQSYLSILFVGWILGLPILGAVMDVVRTPKSATRTVAFRREALV